MGDNVDGISNGSGGLENIEEVTEDVVEVHNILEGMGFDSEKDFPIIDPMLLSSNLVSTFHFSDLEVAYEFYNWYGRMKGFSARRGKV
ncbi:FAR1 DNA-binding domain protein [Sesbania bispinosa]|nr:FAR1 DNA-binding domain protein [Sesbania bispinosa]